MTVLRLLTMDQRDSSGQHKVLRGAGSVRESQTEWVSAEHVPRVTIRDRVTVHLLSGQTTILDPELAEEFGQEMTRAFRSRSIRVV